MKKFELTADHITLLQNMYVGWDNCETGAPCIDPKRPYGNSDVERDIVLMLGWVTSRYEDEDRGESDELREMYIKARTLHEETQTALQICLVTGKFELGTYMQTDQYDFRSWRKTWKKDSEGVASHVDDEALPLTKLKDLHDDDVQEASTPARQPSKALVLRWLGVTVIMDWEGLDLIDEAKVVGELHILDDAGNPPGDGLWVYECSRVDAGASDWGHGLRDTAIDGTWRAPTVAEVEYFKEWHT